MFNQKYLFNATTVHNSGGCQNSSRALNSGASRPKPGALLLLALVMIMALPCQAASKVKKDANPPPQTDQPANPPAQVDQPAPPPAQLDQPRKLPPLSVTSSYQVKVSRFSVTGGDKPGDTATLNMTIETSGSGAKDIPWSFTNGSDVIASGIEHGVGAGKSIDVSATYRLPSSEGVVRLQGSIDPKNTLAEPDGERANNVSQVVEKTLRNPVQGSPATAGTSKRNTAAISAASSSNASSANSNALPLPTPINASRLSGVSAVGDALLKKDSAANTQSQPASVDAGRLAGIATPGNSIAVTSGTAAPGRFEPGKSVSVSTALPTGPLSTSGIKAGSGPSTDGIKADLKQNAVTSLSLDANVFRGSSVQGTVTVESPAGVTGLTVNLSSSSPALGVPASVTIAGGSKTASFTAIAATTGQPGNVTVSAVVRGQGGVAKQASVTVWGAEQVQSLGAEMGNCPLSRGQSSANRNLRPGATCRLMVTLGSSPGPGGARALLSSSSATLRIPPNVTFAAGVRQSYFSFIIAPDAAPGSVTITATGDRPDGVARQYTVNIEAALAHNLVSLGLPSAAEPGVQFSGLVALDGPAQAKGVNVTLTSSSANVTVPPSVSIPRGSSSVAFTVRVAPGASEDNAVISGTRTGPGNPAITQTVAIRPVQVARVGSGSDLSVNGGGFPDRLTIGQVNSMRLTLDGIAKSDVTVSLNSSKPALVAVPASATIPAGQTSTTISVRTASTCGPVPPPDNCSAFITAGRSGPGNVVKRDDVYLVQ
jgi:hypothetical protein